MDETGRKRAATVPPTKPALQTPEKTPKAAARLVSGTLSACAGGRIQGDKLAPVCQMVTDRRRQLGGGEAETRAKEKRGSRVCSVVCR